MRDLTQQEIDDAPDWADSYYADGEHFAYWVSSEASEAESFRSKGAKFEARNECLYLISGSKPIPRQQFDIEQAYENDKRDNQDLPYVALRDGELIFDGIATKQDAIYLAKYFGLTEGDLK